MDIQSGQFNLDYARLNQLSQQAQSARGANASNRSIEGYRNPKTDEERKMRDVANDFESVFVKQLLDAMEQTVEREESLFGNGDAEAYFRDMMNGEMAKQMSAKPGGSNFGLAESIYREIAKQQPAGEPVKKLQMGETIKMGEENKITE